MFDLRPNYGGGSEDNDDLLQKAPSTHCHTQCPQPWSRSLLTHASTRDSWTLMAKSGSVSCGSRLLSPGSWCTQGFVCALQASVSPVLCKFWQLYGGVNSNLLQESLCHTQVCFIPSMKRQKDRTLKDELPRSVDAQYATGDQWRNNSRKNEGIEPKQKQYPVVHATDDRSKVGCVKTYIA